MPIDFRRVMAVPVPKPAEVVAARAETEWRRFLFALEAVGDALKLPAIHGRWRVPVDHLTNEIASAVVFRFEAAGWSVQVERDRSAMVVFVLSVRPASAT